MESFLWNGTHTYVDQGCHWVLDGYSKLCAESAETTTMFYLSKLLRLRYELAEVIVLVWF